MIRSALIGDWTARILNGDAIRDQIYSKLRIEIASLGAVKIRPGTTVYIQHP